MDVCVVIKRRLEELGLEQKGLATAAEVAESYISQLLARKKLPPAPDRTDIYEKMAKFLKLPSDRLSHANHESCFEPLIMTGWLSSGDVMQAIASSSSVKSKRKSTQKRAFDAQAFLDSAGVARKIAEYRRSQKIYAQGDPAASVMYIQTGGVKLSVVNEVGKEAVVGILGPGDFFGEGCLAGQRICMGTATAITPAAILVIEKDEMMRVLHAEHALSDRFMSYILSRNIRIEEDLIDQLFNSSEKRLARTLLLLARYGKDSQPQKMLPKVSQEMLAEMIGTTRSRVNFFMNKFRKLGFIQYNGGLQVHNSLLSVVLHD